MHRYIAILIVCGFLLSVTDASSFTASRYGSVEIVDAPGGILPSFPLSNTNNFPEQNIAAFSKEIILPQRNRSGANTTEVSITNEYLIFGSSNNTQFSLTDDNTQKHLIKFKSMHITSEKSKLHSENKLVKLATLVDIPESARNGKHSLSLRFSAHYE